MNAEKNMSGCRWRIQTAQVGVLRLCAKGKTIIAARKTSTIKTNLVIRVFVNEQPFAWVTIMMRLA